MSSVAMSRQCFSDGVWTIEGFLPGLRMSVNFYGDRDESEAAAAVCRRALERAANELHALHTSEDRSVRD